MFSQICRTSFRFLSVILVLLNTCVVFLPIFVIGLLKLIPIKAWRIFCYKILDALTHWWLFVNNVLIDVALQIKWDLTSDVKFSPDSWYLVLANHQSWVDIIVLQKLLLSKIPTLKFFIKDNLKWIPLLGFAWWVMDYPFMKRYSTQYLEKYPEKKGQDLATTRQTCEKFKNIPVSFMSFIEGTRFTTAKHKQQQSPYAALLKPRAGGIAHVLSSIGEQLNHILDVTIVYANDKKTFWDFLCGRITHIKINIREVALPQGIEIQRYTDDIHTRNQFHTWINDVWYEKNQIFVSLQK